MRYLLILLVLLCGCASTWQQRTTEIWKNTPAEVNCVGRTELLEKELQDAGEDYYVLVGTYLGIGHTWIEKDGEILDPSIVDTNPKYYKRHSIKIVKGNNELLKSK